MTVPSVSLVVNFCLPGHSSGRNKHGIIREFSSFLLCKKILDCQVHGSILLALSCKTGTRSFATVLSIVDTIVDTCGPLEGAPFWTGEKI